MICSANNYSENLGVSDIIQLDENIEIIKFQKSSEYECFHLNISVPIAAAITAYSRIIINRYKHLEGYTPYYSDTDSIVLDRPLPDHLVNSDLGGMKLEHHVQEGVFLGPKLYALKINDVDAIIKVKGLSNNQLTFNDIFSLLNLESINTRHIIWKRRAEVGEINLIEQVYKVSVTSNKREIIRDSTGRFIDTRPFNITPELK